LSANSFRRRLSPKYFSNSFFHIFFSLKFTDILLSIKCNWRWCVDWYNSQWLYLFHEKYCRWFSNTVQIFVICNEWKIFCVAFSFKFSYIQQSTYCTLANNLTSSSTELVCNMGLNQGADTPLFLHILLTYTIHILLLYDRLTHWISGTIHSVTLT